MSCMCGDINCPSCGPAQGHDPNCDIVCEWIANELLADFPSVIDIAWLAQDLTSRFYNLSDGYAIWEQLLDLARRHNTTKEKPVNLVSYANTLLAGPRKENGGNG